LTERRPGSFRKCDEATLRVQYFFTPGFARATGSLPEGTGGEA